MPTSILISADADGNYILNGVSVPVEDMLDATEMGFADPSEIPPLSNGTDWYLNPTIIAMFPTGFTFVMSYVIGHTVRFYAKEKPSNDRFLMFQHSSEEYGMVADVLGVETDALWPGSGDFIGTHKVAVTFDTTHAAFSVDGGSVHTFAVDFYELLNGLEIHTLGGSEEGTTVSAFSFQAAVADAGLPALSAL